jgi:NAD(P)-dependent dehydrogenase (short-subunit alcohol dehydrogenase family)
VLLTGSALHRRPFPEARVWAASTSAVAGLAAALAVELAPAGVRVNTLSHGPVDTPAYEGDGMPPEAVAAMKAGMAAGTLSGRMGTAEEIAELAVTLLVGTSGGFVTGTEIVADGGWALTPVVSAEGDAA